MEGIHGGDVYRNHVELDFSVNVNPLGIPEGIKNALHGAVEICDRYPDPAAEHLKKAVSLMFQKGKGWKVSESELLFGNGASELFMAIVHGIRPGRTVIPVPSFYGYEHVTQAGGGEIVYCQEDIFQERGLGRDDLIPTLTEDVALLFLANPNNPTGRLMDREMLAAIFKHCKERNITVVLDECFIEFCGKDVSMVPEIEKFENLVIVRAFTKIYSIPGVRLGYLVCSNPELLERVGRQLPEWNLSGFAQAAGVVCAELEMDGFIRETAEYVKRERAFLEEGLKKAGITVFPGEANFILVYSDILLYQRLLERGILIRDCKNFRGLKEGFYRIAVRSREENQMLLNRIGEL